MLLCEIQNRQSLANAFGLPPDPIFAAILAAYEAWRCADDMEDFDDGADEVWSDAEEAAFTRLCQTVPTTPAGMASLCDYIAEQAEKSIYDDRYTRLVATLRSGLVAAGGAA